MPSRLCITGLSAARFSGLPRANATLSTHRALVAAGGGHVTAETDCGGPQAVFAAAASLAARGSKTVTVFDDAESFGLWLAQLGRFPLIALRLITPQLLTKNPGLLAATEVLVVAGAAVPRTGPLPAVLAVALRRSRHPLLLSRPGDGMRLHRHALATGGVHRRLSADLAIPA